MLIADKLCPQEVIQLEATNNYSNKIRSMTVSSESSPMAYVLSNYDDTISTG
jgi:hypothetical protein